MGEDETGSLRLEFDRSVKLVFRGSSISSDGGLLLHRELGDALGLTDMAAGLLADPRVGKNGRHDLAGLLRQSIFSRLAGYEDFNDANQLHRDPVMRQLVGGRAVKRGGASASAMGRFETAMLTRPENLAAFADLPGRWIDAEWGGSHRFGASFGDLGLGFERSQGSHWIAEMVDWGSTCNP